MIGWIHQIRRTPQTDQPNEVEYLIVPITLPLMVDLGPYCHYIMHSYQKQVSDNEKSLVILMSLTHHVPFHVHVHAAINIMSQLS
jgi:small neutral amino acid transporter SnatA (MarC family)